MSHTGDALEPMRTTIENDVDRNIFVMMRYGEDPIYKALERVIKDAAHSYGFNAFLARDVRFHDELWRNIVFCMENARYGIVVFERQMQPEFNPNVAVELGYMLGLGKRCLLLKESALHTLPTDVVAQLYDTFRASNVRVTVSRAIENWLERLGHQKIRPTESIADGNVTEAKKKRTARVIDALTQMQSAQPGCIVRQAGSLSSLAISEDEGTIFAEDADLKSSLLKERDAMESLLSSGIVVRCLISPFLQISSFQLKVLSSNHIRSDVLPRLKQLRSVLSRHLDNPNLQIVCTPRLPHDNVLIDELGCQVFVGSRQLRQWGFPQTMIYHDRAMVKREADRFDAAFFDAVGACLGKSELEPVDCGSSQLKLKVIEHLEGCMSQLTNMIAG